MTFALDADPQPLHDPPRVALTVSEPDVELSIQSVSLFRDGVPLRFDAVVTGDSAIAYDYDAPFDVALLYRADGVELGSPIDWSEDWASAADWTGSGWSVGGGVVSSTASGAVIYRDVSSGSIINVSVTSPSNLTLELTDASDLVVVSVLVSPDGTVTLSGEGAKLITGSGSFTLSLAADSVTLAGAGYAASETISYSGVPTRVRLVGPNALTLENEFGSSGTGNGKFNQPVGIAIDGSGDIWVVDSWNHRVQHFDSDGVYVDQIGTGTAGTADGQFDNPSGIAIDGSGNIWVVDSFNNRVQKFNSSGVYVSKFGTGGTGNGQFDHPDSIAVNGSGDMWVTDTGNSRVQKFNSSGTYQSQFGTNGTGDGQFGAPLGLALDGSGNIWVTDTGIVGNHRVQKFNSSGVYQSKITSFVRPTDLRFDASGDLWVVDGDSQTIEKHDPAGIVLPVQVTVSGSPNRIAIDAADHVYVTDMSIPGVREFTQAVGSTDDIAIRIDDGDGPIDVIASDTATLTGVEGAWLTNAAIPDLAILAERDPLSSSDSYFILTPGTRESTQYAAANSVQLEIEGSADVLTTTNGPRRRGTWPLVVGCTTPDAWEALETFLANSSVISLRVPSGDRWRRLNTGFYAVGDVESTRIGHPQMGPVEAFVLPLTPSRAPKFKPLWEWNYNTSAQTGMTYDDLSINYPSYNDLLVGPN